MDDIEYFAFGPRPRDVHPGPHDIPDARTLGRRLTGMRAVYDLSVADVADAAGLRHSVIEELEEYGAISADNLLWLIEVLCAGDRLGEAFLYPSFLDRDDLVTRAERHAGAATTTNRRGFTG